MGEGAYYEDLNRRMAQFELTLLDWAEKHKGARKYVAFADKCWPAFPSQFGFEPCYVNSRLVSRGIPVSCEVDIYGALSEYIGLCVSADAVTLLDINNTVPAYIYDKDIKGKYDYKPHGYLHGLPLRQYPRVQAVLQPCGEVSADSAPLAGACGQRARLHPRHPGSAISPPATSPSIACSATARACCAPTSLRVKCWMCPPSPLAASAFSPSRKWDRFYRHVLVGKRYPHHGAVAFKHVGKALFEVFKFLGVKDIAYNQPASLPYPTENPFA